MIYIIGHIKPDLDSAVSAISLKYLFDNADCFQRRNSRAVLASKANNETRDIFAKFNTIVPLVLKPKQIKSGDTFVLVDHNESSQRLKGIKNEQITDIFDHHKASLNLPLPIFINIKAWGSTNTLIYSLMERENIKPEKNLASLMISAILSDTQGFKSSTTTVKDKIVAKKLNVFANIKNLKKLTIEIFKAKSDLTGLNDKEIITKDYKLYNFGGKKVLINQIETVEQHKLLSRSDKLIQELTAVKNEMKLNHIICVITDVLKINSHTLVDSKDKNLLIKAFPKAKKIKSGVYDIGPLMSRKKEITPKIEKIFL